ncbi:MAG TPA: glycosyltransferase [Acidimicrobiia bacterium]
MNHLLICREYPPAAYPVGGIGTYAANIANLLANAGDTVHVVAQRWSGAPNAREVTCGGRLNIHRIYLEPGPGRSSDPVARELFSSEFPPQAFSWGAALLAEQLIEEEGIDLVEGQDWEAPLFFLQRRRAQRQGPTSRPPILIHLHSPTEMIVSANKWNPGRPDRATAARLEYHSIRAADGWVSPSHFMARTAADHYGLPLERISVIPYPILPANPPPRPPAVWRSGAIVYVGRMEQRKGVLDWVEAAVRVAPRFPEARFVMIGPDSRLEGGSTMRRAAQRLVPADLASRFVFHGEKRGDRLSSILAGARIAVVPSRWDNFPYTCLEAMQSGLPVLTTRRGGMSEVVIDNETGWLADRAESEDLAAALERALGCSPDRLAAMGAAGSEAVRRLCDPDRILGSHLTLRQELVERGGAVPRIGFVSPIRANGGGFVPSQHVASVRAVRSLPYRQRLGVTRHLLTRIKDRVLSRLSDSQQGGMNLGPGIDGLVSVVLIFLNGERFLSEAIESVLAQTYSDWELILVDDGSEPPATAIATEYANRHPGTIRYVEHESHANRGESVSRNLGTRLSRGEFIAFLDVDDVWLPQKLERQVTLMRRYPPIGMTYGSTKVWHSWSGRPGARDYVRPSRIPVDTILAPPRMLEPLIAETEHPGPSSVMIRRSAIDRVGGHEEGLAKGSLYQDTRLFAKLQLSEHIFKSSETWDLYRVRADSLVARAMLRGEHRAARLAFLLWLVRQVKLAGVVDLDLLRTLSEAVRLSRRMVSRGPWWVHVDNPSRVRLDIRGRRARLRIESTADHASEIQLNIRQPAVVAGQYYGVWFEAKSARRRKAYVGVARVEPPFSGLGLYREIDLTPDWRPILLAFIASEDAEVTRVHYDLGNEAISVAVKNVVLRQFGDQEFPLELWSLRVSGGNRAELMIDPQHGVARVDIQEAATGSGHDLQLNIPVGKLQSGSRYRLRFEARALRPRTVAVGVARNGPGWEGLGSYQELELTEVWTVVDRDFVASDSADLARLHLDLGLSATSVEVRSVSLAEVELPIEPAT